ncbi:MAG: fatty acid amide hydrolase 2 [Myxococcota bacterium]|jgi:fatty acid amide hydrolase 2
MHDALRASAVQLAAAIRDGRTTSRAVVDAHIAAIQKVNPAINAVVCDRFEAARAEADAADAAVSAGATLPPLHGVPCTIKEAIQLEGMPNTSGLRRREGIVSTEDATTVARLRAAGAIPLGVTNVSELCMWMESDNLVYGRTNNPYDVRRTAGGSSGGEGAIVGAGASPFGLGADVGGSIRMPAFFNGVFGHKPTGGLIPGTGQHPCGHGEVLRYQTTGPLCRRAEDLWPLVKILAGPDGVDTGCLDWPLGDPDTVDLSGLRVLDIPTNGVTRPWRELRQAQVRAAEHLRRLGADVQTVEIPGFKDGFPIWAASLGAENGVPFAELMGDGERVNASKELAKWAARRGDHTPMASILALAEDLLALVPQDQQRFVDKGLALREELEDRLGEHGVLLYPPYYRSAPRHSWPLLRQVLFMRFDYQYTALLNILQVPVTQVPLRLDSRGLPLGVQVGARRGADHLTVAVARELERAFGGWKPPPMARR